VWQPPSRLVFTWRNANFAAEESTEVEVLDDAAFSRMMGLWRSDDGLARIHRDTKTD
jgi:hypothetical protein